MSVTVINSNLLEQEIREFEKSKRNIDEIFRRERNNLSVMNNGHTWVGKTQETMCNAQYRFQNNFDPILEALDVYIRYLKDTLQDFKRFEEQRQRDLQNNETSMDVNSN